MKLSGRVANQRNAIDVIIDTIKAFPKELEVVALGALTNIALALTKAPEIAQLVKQCTMMIRAFYKKNRTLPSFWKPPANSF